MAFDMLFSVVVQVLQEHMHIVPICIMLLSTCAVSYATHHISYALDMMFIMPNA